MRVLRYLATLTVIAGSLLPGGSAALHALSALHMSDKMQHFLAYAVLAWFAGWMDSRRAAWIACVSLVGLGVLLEILQMLVPGRSCELLDVAADLGGVVGGLILGAWLASFRAGAPHRQVAVALGELPDKIQ